MTQSRQLAAIMFTDIVGYTAIMGENEQLAFELLKKNRDIQKPIIEAHHGRWIKELGDGVMASFGTVTDAVLAGIRILEASRTAADFQLRIGIHVGEVVFERDDVFGDGVNVASRIQSCAQPGSIYISESVHHNVANKKDIRTRFVSEEALKNVKDPVRIYEVILMHDSAAPHAPAPSEVRPNSIAVLPFTNMSSDPEQEYFSDGLTEEIITDLSKIDRLLVISRSSVMTLKGTNKKMKEIAREVNVRYVLEGSVRKAGNQLRITAQLIDAANDAHIWSEKYTGTLDDVFDIQENVSRSIAEALKVKLTPEEDQQMAERPVADVRAYDCYLKARQEVFRSSQASMDNAFRLLQNGLELVGPNDLLYAMLGYTSILYFRFVDKSDNAKFAQAKKYAARALALNPDLPLAHVLQGWIHWTEGNLQDSCDAMKRAIDIEPNNHDALFGLTESYLYAGKASVMHHIADKLLAIDPLTPMSHIMKGGFHMDGAIKESLPHFRKAYALDPHNPLTRWMLASAYFWCGLNEEAFPLIDRLAEDMPEWSFTRQILFLKHGVQGDRERALSYASEELEAEAKNDMHFAFHLAECYAVIGDKEKALDLLAYAMKIFYPLRFLSGNPLFANIREEQQFQDLMKDAELRSSAFRV